MITIHPMPTRLRPLPELELWLSVPQLRELAGALDRVKIGSNRRAGLCLAVAAKASVETQQEFQWSVSRGMNKDAGVPDWHYRYLYQYLGYHLITIEELTAIRQAWAIHIARSIYEQIGD